MVIFPKHPEETEKDPVAGTLITLPFERTTIHIPLTIPFPSNVSWPPSPSRYPLFVEPCSAAPYVPLILAVEHFIGLVVCAATMLCVDRTIAPIASKIDRFFALMHNLQATQWGSAAGFINGSEFEVPDSSTTF